MLVSRARLDVVDSLRIGDARSNSGVGQRTALAHRLSLQVGREIREKIRAGVVVILVAANESAQSKDCVVVNNPGPRRGYVKSLDLRALVGRTYRQTVRSKPAIIDHKPGPCAGTLGVDRIRSLEPRSRISEIDVQGIGLGKLEVHSIKKVLLITLIVSDEEFRRIEKASAIQSAYGNKIAPFLAAIAKVKANVGRAEAAVGGGNVALGLGQALSRARGHVNHGAGLFTIFSGRRAGNHFERIHRVERNLVGKNLALLVGDRLFVHREGSLRVIAKRMEGSVGVGGDAGRSQRDRRTERRGSALQGKPFDNGAIDIGVERRRLFQKILGFSFDAYDFRGAGECKSHRYIHGHKGTDVDILRVSAKARLSNGQVVGVEGKIRKTKFPGPIRDDHAVQSADGVLNRYGRIGDHSSRGIEHGTGNRRRVARLGKG